MGNYSLFSQWKFSPPKSKIYLLFFLKFRSCSVHFLFSRGINPENRTWGLFPFFFYHFSLTFRQDDNHILVLNFYSVGCRENGGCRNEIRSSTFFFSLYSDGCLCICSIYFLRCFISQMVRFCYFSCLSDWHSHTQVVGVCLRLHLSFDAFFYLLLSPISLCPVAISSSQLAYSPYFYSKSQLVYIYCVISLLIDFSLCCNWRSGILTCCIEMPVYTTHNNWGGPVFLRQFSVLATKIWHFEIRVSKKTRNNVFFFCWTMMECLTYLFELILPLVELLLGLQC